MKPYIKYYAHYDKETGEILGLYNSQRHQFNIPVPHTSISAKERDQIAQNPGAYSVNVEDAELIHHEVEQSPESEIDLEQINRDYNAEIVAGVMIGDVCYYSDAESSALLSLQLASDVEKPKVRAIKDGKETLLAVERKKALKIANAITEKRIIAMQKRIDSLTEARSQLN